MSKGRRGVRAAEGLGPEGIGYFEFELNIYCTGFVIRGLTGASAGAVCKIPVKLMAGCHYLFRVLSGTDLVSVPTWKYLVLLSKRWRLTFSWLCFQQTCSQEFSFKGVAGKELGVKRQEP